MFHPDNKELRMPSNEFLYLFCNGFLDSPIAAQYFLKLVENLGVEFENPDLTGGEGHLTSSISKALLAIEDFYNKNRKPIRIYGYSLGGYITALYASKHPDHVDRLFLINPTINAEVVWPEVMKTYFTDSSPESMLKKWKGEEKLVFSGPHLPEAVTVGYDFYLDSLTHPSFPVINVPVRIVSGIHDEAVPTKILHDWKRAQNDPNLFEVVEIDDGHVVAKESVLKQISESAIQFFD